MDVSDNEDEDETPEAKSEWRDARWEQLLPGHIDEVFERFVRRLQNADSASNQVLRWVHSFSNQSRTRTDIRYELGGVPLPYSSRSPLYKRLFPGAPTTKTADEDEEPDFSQFFDTSSIPACLSCGGKRVFEMQLVPSLISVLRPETITTTGQPAPKKSAKQTEEERRRELAMLAKGLKNENGEKADVGEMEWGNVLVFGCEKDCVGLVEEYVAVDWEAQLTQEQMRPPPEVK